MPKQTIQKFNETRGVEPPKHKEKNWEAWHPVEDALIREMIDRRGHESVRRKLFEIAKPKKIKITKIKI